MERVAPRNRVRCGRRPAAERADRVRAVAGLLIVVAASWSPLRADLCAVPSEYPTIGQAVAAPRCTEIAIAAGTFPERVVIDRPLIVQGSGVESTTLAGQLVVTGPAAVTLTDLLIDTDGCYPAAMLLASGAELEPDRVDVIDSGSQASCALFADGFESGDTSHWSVTIP